MVEAIYDYQDGYCEPFTVCRYPLDNLYEYKTKSGLNNPHASNHLRKYQYWKMILSIFGLRIKCLFDVEKLDYYFYSSTVSTESIFQRQKKNYK